MDDNQMSMYDFVTPVPKMWDCTETCKHFGENVDYPSWWNGKARCLIPAGGSGRNARTESVVFDNSWFTYCTYYEKKVAEKIGVFSGMDREKVIKELRELHGSKETMKLISDTIKLLKEQEATWVEYPECLKYENAYSTDHIVCSACQYVFSTIDNCTEEFMHCPHCGAKMI